MNFYTFSTSKGDPIFGYIKAKNEDEAKEKAKDRWSDVDLRSCRVYHGVL